MTAITTPERVGGRDQGRSVAESIAGDIAGSTLIVDFSHTDVVTPSFLDEMIKVLLEERELGHLTLRGLGERDQRLARRSAEVRALQDRLTLD